MANENRYFSTPFAENGDKAEVPNVSVDGAVGYDTGFGPNYELPQGDVDRKRIERDLYNGMHNSITKNLKQWQESLYPTWIEDNGSGVAFPYSKGMIVSHSGSFWISSVNSNQEEPGAGSKWKSYDANFDLPALTSTVEIPLLSGNVVEDQLIRWQGYYAQSDGGSNWGVVKFGAHTADGGSVFSIDSNTYVVANLKGGNSSVLKFGAYSDGVRSSHNAIQLALALTDKAYFPRLANGNKYVTSEPIYLDTQKSMYGDKGYLVLLEKTTNNKGVGSNTSASGEVDSYDKDAVVILRHEDGIYTTYVDITNMHLKSGANNDYVIYAPRAFVNNFKNIILDVQDGLKGYYTNDTFMSQFEDVQVTGDYNNVVGSIGFEWDDEGTGGSGTSCAFTRCWVRDGIETAIKARGLVYSTFESCGADRWVKHAVDLDLCDVTFNGFGFENRSQVGTSPFKLRYSRVNINSAVGFSVNIADGSYLVDAQGGVTNINGIRQTTTAAGAGKGSAWRVADGAVVNVSGVAISNSLGSLSPAIEGASFFSDIDKGTRQSVGIKNNADTLVGELKSIFTDSLLLQSSEALYLGSSGTATLFSDIDQFRPYLSDGVMSLGSFNNRFNTLYAATGTINTSDERAKTELSGLTTDELNASKQLCKEIGSYKFLSAIALKGDGARLHIGMTVQRAIEIMEANNLSPFRYGFICYDEWGDEVVNHEAVYEYYTEMVGDVEERRARLVEEAYSEVVVKAGNAYAFRYDELNQFILAGISARLDALEM